MKVEGLKLVLQWISQMKKVHDARNSKEYENITEIQIMVSI